MGQPSHALYIARAIYWLGKAGGVDPEQVRDKIAQFHERTPGQKKALFALVAKHFFDNANPPDL